MQFMKTTSPLRSCKAHRIGLHAWARLPSFEQPECGAKLHELDPEENTKTMKNVAMVKSSDDRRLPHDVMTLKPCCASVDAKNVH